MDIILAEAPDENFAAHWLETRGLSWAAELMTDQFPNLQILNEEYVPWFDAAE